ncbi:MAG TPA: branched-chain amino acid transport system II carrier protein [Gammaproteobacteria bacterium]|nr:branched-chain amino acid transport system II carrier protein [Gammaproteobacteria bacterium]
MLRQKSSWLTGFALFAMFFGAGNVTFPLLVGQYAGQHYLWAMVGLLITAVIVPVLCILSMIMFNGEYRAFFYRIGRWPGWFLILLSVLLLGPFFVLPRVVTVAHGALTYELVDISLPWFALGFCLLTLLLTVKNNIFIKALGYVLTPLMLLFCVVLIALGMHAPPVTENIQTQEQNFIIFGLIKGYFTFDAVAALFFAGILLKSVKSLLAKNKQSPKRIFKVALVASFIGGGLLALVYIGLAYVAAKHGQFLYQGEIDEAQILTALSYHLFPGFEALSALLVFLACITTALALTVLFADFLQDELQLRQIKLPYVALLGITLVIAFLMSTLGFTGLMSWIGPMIVFCYPIFIVLALCNLAYQLWGWQWVKTPVYLTLVLMVLV